jgi:hypothetical protein
MCAARFLPLALVFCAAPLCAQNQSNPPRPVTDTSVSIGDAVTSPVTDLNLRRDAIPPLLIAAQARPYDLAGLARCGQIMAAVREIDAVLGDDVDLPPSESEGISAGRVAQAAVGSVIPFHGLIREVSGANSRDRQLAAAIAAGAARRAFLKGYGQARGCRYPARAAPAAALAPQQADATASTERSTPRRHNRRTRYVSQPVVQPTPRHHR